MSMVGRDGAHICDPIVLIFELAWLGHLDWLKFGIALLTWLIPHLPKWKNAKLDRKKSHRSLIPARWIAGRRWKAKSRNHNREVNRLPRLLRQWVFFNIAVILCIIIVLWICPSRIGEAQNPGPEGLALITCNPTTIWNKEKDILKMCPAIIGVSETAATVPVQKQMSKWCYERCMHVQWSSPVGTLGKATSGFLGLAVGTAVFSTYPQRPSLAELTEDVLHSNRFCETHIQFLPHRFLYFASLYGPTAAFKYADPSTLMNRLFEHAAQRANSFQGPAAIVGDFNVTLDKLGAWPFLRSKGWVDAAQLAAEINNHELENTSCDAVRHSFILINAELARSLKNAEHAIHICSAHTQF